MPYRRKKVGLVKLEIKEAELLIKQGEQEKDLRTFLQNRAFRFNCKKLLVSWTLQKRFYKTKAPFTNDIHLGISLCLRRFIGGTTPHVTRSRALTQSDSYSLFSVKTNNNREKRNWVIIKWCCNTLKMLSCNRKLWYQWNLNVTPIWYKINKGNAISLSCDLKKHYLEKYCSLSQTTSSAAAILRVDIISYSSAVKDKHWPPTVGTVTAQYGSPTDLVKLFLNSLLDIALATKKGI